MSSAFDLEGPSFLPAGVSADVAAAADPASGQKRLRPEEAHTASGQKQLRACPKNFVGRPASATQSVRQALKQSRTDDDEQTAFGQKRRKVEHEEDNMEDDAGSDGGQTAKTCTSIDSGGDLWLISHAHGKVAVCAYCNKKADSRSPLQGSSSDDPYGGYLPWNSYQKYPQGLGHESTPFKKPSGFLCGICSQSYSASGMAAQHGKINVYKKNVMERSTTENIATHKVFLDMRAIWIKEYNDEHKPGLHNDSFTASGKKMKTKLSVAAQRKVKSRYVEVRKQTKTSVEGRERVFIEKKFWDEKLDGRYDASKETSEVLHGATRIGCWKWTSREGVWKGTTQEATIIDDVHVEESGSGGLVENAADVKANALREGFFGMEAVRDTHSVEAPFLGFDDLMQLAGFNADAAR